MAENAFSIVIPQFNKSSMTQKCIDSIINNTLLDYQIVLVDNGSEDEISEEYKEKVTYIKNEENLLFAGGCNVGANFAEHDVICFLNNDILLSSGWDDCVEFLLKEEKRGIIAPKLIYPNGLIQHAGVQILSEDINHATFDHRYRNLPQGDPRVNEVREYQCVTGACIFIRKEDFKRVNGFHKYHNGYEDNDLCFKIRFDLGKKVVYYPYATLIHKESVTSRTVPYQEAPNKELFFERWGDKIKEDKKYWDGVDGVGI